MTSKAELIPEKLGDGLLIFIQLNFNQSEFCLNK